MKLNVDHLVVVSQYIEVPDKCPKCQANLTEERALKLWEFQDQSRFMTSRLLDGGEYERDCCDDMPQSGECFMSCSWSCAKCDHTLAEHNEIRFDVDDPDRMPPSSWLLDQLKLDDTSG